MSNVFKKSDDKVVEDRRKLHNLRLATDNLIKDKSLLETYNILYQIRSYDSK